HRDHRLHRRYLLLDLRGGSDRRDLEAVQGPEASRGRPGRRDPSVVCPAASRAGGRGAQADAGAVAAKPEEEVGETVNGRRQTVNETGTSVLVFRLRSSSYRRGSARANLVAR